MQPYRESTLPRNSELEFPGVPLHLKVAGGEDALTETQENEWAMKQLDILA